MGQRGGRPDGVIGLAAVLVLLSLAAVAGAQDKTPPDNALQAPPPAPAEEVVLPPLLVTAPPPVASSSEQLIPGKDFEVRPQGRPADVLRLIPGLIIAQHQGGGKAEQYLIRGFDADHGTDLALFIDGLQEAQLLGLIYALAGGIMLPVLTARGRLDSRVPGATTTPT